MLKSRATSIYFVANEFDSDYFFFYRKSRLDHRMLCVNILKGDGQGSWRLRRFEVRWGVHLATLKPTALLCDIWKGCVNNTRQMSFDVQHDFNEPSERIEPVFPSFPWEKKAIYTNLMPPCFLFSAPPTRFCHPLKNTLAVSKWELISRRIYTEKCETYRGPNVDLTVSEEEEK